MPDLWQEDPNAIRYEDQEVRRSNTELTDEGPQGDPIQYDQLASDQVGHFLPEFQ